MVASDIWDVGEWFESNILYHKRFRLKGKDGCLYKAENGGSSPLTSNLEVNKGQFFGYFLCWPRLNITNVLDIEIKVNKNIKSYKENIWLLTRSNSKPILRVRRRNAGAKIMVV